jgi:hypothetical protein
MLKWVEKLITGKADKEAETILKANKLKLLGHGNELQEIINHFS